MRHICHFFISAQEKISIETLEYFGDMIGELEILCDSMEDFFLNKHFKSDKMGKRLYFKEEEVQQLKYCLDQRRNKKEE